MNFENPTQHPAITGSSAGEASTQRDQDAVIRSYLSDDFTGVSALLDGIVGAAGGEYSQPGDANEFARFPRRAVISETREHVGDIRVSRYISLGKLTVEISYLNRATGRSGTTVVFGPERGMLLADGVPTKGRIPSTDEYHAVLDLIGDYVEEVDAINRSNDQEVV